MSQISRIYTFSTNPSISSDIGSKIDQELNQIINTINFLDDANIDGLPKIQSSKLDLGGAGFLPLAGGSLTSVLNHAFEGVWRSMGLIGTSGLVREYRSLSGGNIVWGIAYNTSPDGNGNWTGRDIADICLRVELTKTSDGWGGLRVYTADSLGANSLPVWNPVQHYAPMGGHSRYHNGTAWTNIGDITATSGTVSGILNYNTLIIPSTVTWTLAQGQPLIIFARESVTINGTITGDGLGALTGTNSIAGGAGGGGGGQGGTGVGVVGANSYYVDIANGGTAGPAQGNGGVGGNAPSSRLLFPLPIYDAPSKLVVGGAGGANGGGSGGSGGNGGGCVCIIAPVITVAGSINCKGANGVAYSGSGGGGGGGGGGVIYIQAKSYTLSGSVLASGGIGATNSGSGGDGGNGGAGVIYIEEYR